MSLWSALRAEPVSSGIFHLSHEHDLFIILLSVPPLSRCSGGSFPKWSQEESKNVDRLEVLEERVKGGCSREFNLYYIGILRQFCVNVEPSGGQL